MKRGNIMKLVGLLLLIGVLTAVSIKPLTNPENGILLGLDLRGGVHLVLQAEPGEDGKDVTNDDIDKAKAIISKRVNELGVSEPVIQSDYSKKRLIVDLAGMQDPEKAVAILQTTAKLTFRDPDGNIVLDGSELKDARAGQQKGTTGYVVNLTFTDTGTEKFAEITSKSVGKKIGIYLDETMLTEPMVKTAITGGSAYIDGYKTIDEAAQDAVLLRSGALPVSLSIAEKRQVGASLGADSLDKSIFAGIVGISFIFLFMVGFYRLPGLVADLSLVVYALIVLWVTWGIHAVLTLPGIAGLILSIGMAVDFNIIIYERVKEEIRSGKSLRASVDTGFSRAFLTVIDSHVTTLFAVIALYIWGTSAIKGFALTLGIGIIASLFTAITFTRFVLKLIVGINPKLNVRWFGVRRDA